MKTYLPRRLITLLSLGLLGLVIGENMSHATPPKLSVSCEQAKTYLKTKVQERISQDTRNRAYYQLEKRNHDFYSQEIERQSEGLKAQGYKAENCYILSEHLRNVTRDIEEFEFTLVMTFTRGFSDKEATALTGINGRPSHEQVRVVLEGSISESPTSGFSDIYPSKLWQSHNIIYFKGRMSSGG